MEEHETTEETYESMNHRWATLRRQKLLRGTTFTAPSAEVPVSRKKTITQTTLSVDDSENCLSAG